MKWFDYFKRWHFDPVTSVVSIVIAPFLIYLLKILLGHLKKFGAYALEGVLYSANRVLWQSLSASLSLRRYCKLQLGSESRHLFVPSSRDIKLDLDEVFVTLTMEYQGSSRSDYSHRDLLEISNRIRVIGDPGSGKSSLAKKLFRDACQNAIANPRKSRLPLLVELKSLQPPKGLKPERSRKWLYDHLIGLVKRSAVYKMGECLDLYAQSEGLLVLLDGFDEVALADYARVHAVVDGLNKTLAEKSDKNIVVLTMRTQFHQQVKDSYRDNFGPALFIKPFSPTDIFEFLTRWPFQTNRAANISRIFKQLTDRPTLREMCTNPLILSMYVAEDQNSTEVLAPESRTQFYSKVTDELMLKRRLKQTGLQAAPLKLKEQRERILGRVCFEHLLDPSEPANSLSWDKGLEIVKDVTRETSELAERFRELSKETGLFTEERTGESFRFIHLTICEFLAAYETVQGQRDGWKQLLSRHRAFLADRQPQTRTRLLEVIPFACGLLPRVQRDQALTDVASLNDFRLLARCFFETKLYEHSSWQAFVRKAQDEILNTPENMWDEKWLADLHLLNLVVLDAQQSAQHLRMDTVVDLSVLYQNLVERQTDSLAKLLGGYAAQDAAAAFRIAEVCRLDLPVAFPEVVIKNCDQPPFFALVREQAAKDPDRVNLWMSLLAEAGLRSRVVAYSLNQMQPDETLDAVLRGVSRRHYWFAANLLPRTYYTQAITVAVTAKIDSIHFAFLQLLSELPSPGQRRGRSDLAMWSLRLVLVLMLSTYLVFIVNSVGGHSLLNAKFASMAVAEVTAVGYICAILVFILIRGRINAYRTALNLGDPSGSTEPRSKGARPLTLPSLLTLRFPFASASRILNAGFCPRELKDVVDALSRAREHRSAQPSLRAKAVAAK
jgi:hypothetical protein